MLELNAGFSEESQHKVDICIHDSVRKMRNYLRKDGHKDCDDADAVCAQLQELHPAHLIAELHFALDTLTEENVIHECVHAAYHRGRMLGKKTSDPTYEEDLATDAGTLAANILLGLRKLRIPIKKSF